MDAFRIVQCVSGSIQRLTLLLASEKKLRGELSINLCTIKRELPLIKWDIVQLPEDAHLQLQLQELAYDIDDFVHGLWVPGPCTSFILSATGLNPGPQDIECSKSFVERIKSLKERVSKGSCDCEEKQSEEGSATATATARPPVRPCYAPEADLVGIAEPKQEIVELLTPALGPLKVISIVGCSGMGKTALARALYADDQVTVEFDRTAWVVASGLSTGDILHKIFQEVDLAPADGSASQALPHFPHNRRFLVFVDDVQREGIPWEDLQDAFLGNDMGSRIIVTTRIPSVVKGCSSGSYMYRMQRLDQANSAQLLRAKFQRKAHAFALGNDISKSITDKCDGLPVALIGAANYLRGKGPDPTWEDCERLSLQVLGDYLVRSQSAFDQFKNRKAPDEATAFEEMRRAVVPCYEDLPDHGHRNCLLYVSMFPKGHQINSKNLVSRIIAEGLVPRDAHIMRAQELVAGDVRECLEELIDSSLIDTVPNRSHCKVSTRCQVHGIMLEFTIKKAVSRNFVSLIHKDKPLHNTQGSVRRLSVQSSPNVGCNGYQEKIGFSALRSLAIFNSGILDFKSCKMIRVLDLQGCCGLTKKVVVGICGSLFLKYLSLRNTDILSLPREVMGLMQLETLDIRETKVEILPMKVLMLPQLAYLFGKFELTDVPLKDTKKLARFLATESQLHTLAGISISVDKTQGLEIVLQHARLMKKVKVWCKNTPRSSTGPARGVLKRTLARLRIDGRQKVPAGSSDDPSISTRDTAPAACTPEPNNTCASRLESSLEKRSVDLEYLFVDFNGVGNSFLGNLNAACTICSIKVRQGLGSLPGSAELRQLRNLKKLHLFSTGLTSGELKELQNLVCLEHLKLAEEDCRGSWNGQDFSVQSGGFPRLVLMCFEALKHPWVEIEDGAMTRLASLQLLCPESPPQRGEGEGEAPGLEERLGVKGLSHLANLNEVILHHSATDATVVAWKEAAKMHMNRPNVKKKQQ